MVTAADVRPIKTRAVAGRQSLRAHPASQHDASTPPEGEIWPFRAEKVGGVSPSRPPNDPRAGFQ